MNIFGGCGREGNCSFNSWVIPPKIWKPCPLWDIVGKGDIDKDGDSRGRGGVTAGCIAL